MKTLLILAFALCASSAMANGPGYYEHDSYGRGYGSYSHGPNHHHRHRFFRNGNERSIGPARGRVCSMEMSCADVQATVSHRGAVIVNYGEGLYERVVAHNGFCSRATGDYTEPFFVPTADSDQCFAGYLCHPNQGE
jgi:hypothetical protein